MPSDAVSERALHRYKAIMVHADAAKYTPGSTKQEVYDQLLEQAEALFAGQRNWVCNLANTASLLWHAYKSLPSPSNQVNWAGFYVLDPQREGQLILGPFQGKVACQTIAFGRGACGAAAASGKSQLVPDVENYPGHIACDGDTASEIVVPVIVDGKVVAVVDVDCTLRDGFDEDDQMGLEKLASILARSCNW